MKKMLLVIGLLAPTLAACQPAGDPVLQAAGAALAAKACSDFFKKPSQQQFCVTSAGAAVTIAQAYQTYKQTGAAP